MATSARWPLKTKLSLNQLSVVDGLDQFGSRSVWLIAGPHSNTTTASAVTIWRLMLIP